MSVFVSASVSVFVPVSVSLSRISRVCLHSFFVTVDPSWAVSKGIEAFKKKFSKEAVDYTVYVETDTNYLQLDPLAKFNEISQVKKDVGVLLLLLSLLGSR